MEATRRFYSYVPLLLKYLQQKKPKTILEWGPGISTHVMAAECPEAEIDTYESEERYYQTTRYEFIENSRVHIHYVPDQTECANAPRKLDKRFDLIFVDGRRRVACMEAAKGLLADDGVLILHDSEREEYAPGIGFYETLETLDGTTALGKPKQV